jgi:excisionase family DNA binding protein
MGEQVPPKEPVMRQHEPEPEKPERAEMLSYREAAKFLGLPVATLYSLVRERRVPHVRLGLRLVRFPREELRRWVASRLVEERRPQ